MSEPAATPPLSIYQGRFKTNVLWLAEQNGYSIRRLAGLADLAHQTIRSWLSGTYQPTLGNMGKLAEVLGVEPGDLLVDPEELQAKVEEIGLRPFALPRPSTIKASFGSASPSRSKGKGKRADKPGLSPLCQLDSVPKWRIAA